MRRERLFLYLSLTANVALLVALLVSLGKVNFSEMKATAALRQAHELAQRLNELESAGKTRVANPPALSDAEVLELARLRNEVTRLRSEQRSAPPTSRAATSPKGAPVSATPQQAALAGITALTSTLSANVGLGQALAVGGWASPTPGRRIVGLISPELHADSPGSVLVTTRLIEFPDATMEQLGLHGLRTDATASQSKAVFTTEEFKALIERAEKMDGVDVLTAPRVVTRSGAEARVSVRQAHPDGTQTGPLINLTPTLDATGTAVRLDVGLELNYHLPAKHP